MKVTKRCPQCSAKLIVAGNGFVGVTCPNCQTQLFVDHGAFTDATSPEELRKREEAAMGYVSQAWLLIGLVNSLPGILILHQGKLSFTAIGPGTLWKRGLQKLEKKTGIKGLTDQLSQGQTIQLFNFPAVDIERVTFPFFYFSAGMHLYFNRQKYRLSFIQPGNTQMPHFKPSGKLGQSLLDLNALGSARTVGRQWKNLLKAPSSENI